MAKYSVFKGEITNQSFHDVPSISALISLQAKLQRVFVFIKAHAGRNDFVFLGRHCTLTKQ